MYSALAAPLIRWPLLGSSAGPTISRIMHFHWSVDLVICSRALVNWSAARLVRWSDDLLHYALPLVRGSGDPRMRKRRAM